MVVSAKARVNKAESILFALHPRVFDLVDRFFNIPRILDRAYLGRLFKKQYRNCLDIGAGMGSLTRFLGKYCQKLTCLDKDKRKLRVLQGRAPGGHDRVAVVWGEAESLSFGDKAFDLIFSNCVLEHIREDEKVLVEIARCIKVGGSLIMTFPNSKMQAGWFKRLLFKNSNLRFLADATIKKYFSFPTLKEAERWYAFYRWQHVRRGYTLAEVKKRLAKYNLQVEEEFYYPGKILTELWEIITFSRLNVLFPYVMIPFIPLFYLLPKKEGNERTSLEFGILAKKEK